MADAPLSAKNSAPKNSGHESENSEAKPKMSRDELVARLKELQSCGDPEIAHGEADDVLLEFIGDPEVSNAFNAIDRWYA